MPEKLETSPDYWRKRAEEARRLAELIDDNRRDPVGYSALLPARAGEFKYRN
jgi:hypothetical protein